MCHLITPLLFVPTIKKKLSLSFTHWVKLNSLILDLLEIHSLDLQPLLVPCLLKRVLSGHRQTYVPVLVRQSIFPRLKNPPLQPKTIMPWSIVFLHSLRLQVIDSLLQMRKIPLFEIWTVECQTLVACCLLLDLDHASKMCEKLWKVVKLNFFFHLLVVPCNFQASEYFLLHLSLSFLFHLNRFVRFETRNRKATQLDAIEYRFELLLFFLLQKLITLDFIDLLLKNQLMMNYKSIKVHSLLSFLYLLFKLNNLDKQSHFLKESLPMKSKLFVSDNLQFESMIKRWVFAKRIKLHSVCNELVGEFFIQDLLDVRLVQTVLQRALVAKSQTVAALVFKQSGLSLLFCQSLW